LFVDFLGLAKLFGFGYDFSNSFKFTGHQITLLSRPIPGLKLALVLTAILPVILSCYSLGQASGANCVAEHYRVIPLPFRPAQINSASQVIGTTASHRAAVWQKQSGLRELPLAAGFYNSEGTSANSSGDAVGVLYDRAFGKHRAFIYANGTLTLLAGDQSHAYSINDSDQMVGESLIPGKTSSEPVSWTNNVVRSLGGCCGGSAKSVNKNGEIVGDVYDASGRYQAFFWTPSRGLHPIGPADRYSSAIALNDQGHAVVQAFSEVFIYANEKLAPIKLSPQYPSQPRAMNNCDVVVGSFGPFADAERAFVWDRSRGFRDLNDVIAPASGWKLESAASINDRGEIVGRGDFKGDDDTGFLLVPEP
jgi:hypothetical protein